MIVVVILGVVGVITAKESMRSRQARQPVAAGEAPEGQGAADGIAPNGPPRSSSQESNAAPQARSVGSAATKPDAEAPAPTTPAGSPQSSTKTTEPQPAPDKQAKKPEGPLPGSQLADCLKSGRPTMADFGKGWCVPCKMMVPVLKKAAQDYWGKANIVFVELDEYPDLGRQYRIATMPTQVFFDARGNEVARRMGYMGSEDIERQLAALGVKK